VKNRPTAAPVQKPEPLWTTEDVCTFLRMAPGTLYSLRSAGTAPPAFRVGKFLLFRQSDVLAWLEAHADSAA